MDLRTKLQQRAAEQVSPGYPHLTLNDRLNYIPLQCHNWESPFNVLYGSQPDITHPQIFAYAAYLLEDMQANKMAHKSELMVYINVTPENKSTHI